MLKNKRVRMLLLAFYDVIAGLISCAIALWVRFDFSVFKIPENYARNALYYSPVYVLTILIVFYMMHLINHLL